MKEIKNSYIRKISYFVAISIFLFSIFYFLFSSQVVAESPQIDLGYPWGTPESQTPAGFINEFYKIALGLVGAAALGVIIFGAVLYTVSAGNTSRQQDAKEWITGAVWGVALLLCAYLILHTINPNLVILRNPAMEPIKISSLEVGTGIGGGGSEYRWAQIPMNKYCRDVLGEGWVSVGSEHCTGESPGLDYDCCGYFPEGQPGPSSGASPTLNEQSARNQLQSAGIGVKNECPVNQSTDCVKLDGIRQSTLDEAISLKKACSCEVYVTGGTEQGVHVVGPRSHTAGYKVDLRLNNSLNNYIENNFIESNGPRGKQYINPKTGNTYFKETGAEPHWDVLAI